MDHRLQLNNNSEHVAVSPLSAGRGIESTSECTDGDESPINGGSCHDRTANFGSAHHLAVPHYREKRSGSGSNERCRVIGNRCAGNAFLNGEFLDDFTQFWMTDEAMTCISSQEN